MTETVGQPIIGLLNSLVLLKTHMWVAERQRVITLKWNWHRRFEHMCQTIVYLSILLFWMRWKKLGGGRGEKKPASVLVSVDASCLPGLSSSDEDCWWSEALESRTQNLGQWCERCEDCLQNPSPVKASTKTFREHQDMYRKTSKKHFVFSCCFSLFLSRARFLWDLTYILLPRYHTCFESTAGYCRFSLFSRLQLNSSAVDSLTYVA